MHAATDRNNLVSFVERALFLKTLPVLDKARPDQIAAILHHLRDRSFVPGAALFRTGESPEEIHVILEGRARMNFAGGSLRRGPGQLVGVQSALEQRPRSSTCVSETAVQTLALRVDDLHELLEDFFDLTRALLAFYAGRVLVLGGPDARAAEGDAGSTPAGGLSGPAVELIDKIVFMKSVRLLQGASIDELARLGREVTESVYDAGDEVFREGDRADAFYLVLRGRLGGRGARASVGALDVLRQGAYARTARADEPSRALRVPAERFFDLLEDHFAMTSRLLGDLSAAARRLALAQAVR
jgi:CRP-like cAMP-binding protein